MQTNNQQSCCQGTSGLRPSQRNREPRTGPGFQFQRGSSAAALRGCNTAAAAAAAAETLLNSCLLNPLQGSMESNGSADLPRMQSNSSSKVRLMAPCEAAPVGRRGSGGKQRFKDAFQSAWTPAAAAQVANKVKLHFCYRFIRLLCHEICFSAGNRCLQLPA